MISEFLDYLHPYNELFWIWEQSLNMNLVMLGIQPCTTQGLNAVHTMLLVCLALTITQHVVIISCQLLRKFQILEFVFLI